MVKRSADNPRHVGCRVFIDGVEVMDVIECDTEAGTLTKYARNPDGSFKLDIGKSMIETETLTGVVTVEDRPGPDRRPTGEVQYKR